jgi:hypothetical protein
VSSQFRVDGDDVAYAGNFDTNLGIFVDDLGDDDNNFGDHVDDY